MTNFSSFVQEIYRPGTSISNASNLCTAVGGDHNKEFRGKTSIMRGGGGNKGYCYRRQEY